MLTSVFYYNFYKPYLISSNDSSINRNTKRSKIGEKTVSEDTKVLLNKSLKNEVVNYARDVSRSVVGTKDSAKNLVRDMEEFNKNIYKQGYETAKTWISEDLEEFAESFNDAQNFLSKQKHSVSLRQFSERIVENVEYNRGKLESLAFAFTDDKKLRFDTSKFENLEKEQIDSAIGETLNLFQNLYADSSDVLRAPLTEHMKFKGLGYYYNYKMGSIEADTFKMIEAGMIIDVVV